MGISDHLDDFAARHGADTWKNRPDPASWKPGVLGKLSDPNQRVLFNLDGVDVWPGVTRAAAGRGGATDWELLQVRGEDFPNLEFWQGGKRVGEPVRMIATYPDRRFQLWEYRVSHGSLLIRSPKGPEAESNVDLIFVGVDYLAVPHSLKGVVVDHGAGQDVAAVNAAYGEVVPERVFALLSQGHRHLIVAVACRVAENDGDIFDSPL